VELRALCAYFGQPERIAAPNERVAAAPEREVAATEREVAAAETASPSDAGSCDACDVCLGEVARVEGSQVLAQKILSCVVRCGQRFGAAHVTDILRGAQTEKMRQTGHDKLSTYGLLKDASTREIRAWIEQLTGQGHLRVTDGEYPTLFLSRTGVEVMRGARPVVLFVPAVPAAKKSRTASSARAAIEQEIGAEAGVAVDERLFEHLRRFRRELAAQRSVPPYVIFSDRSLALMAARKPRTPEEFRAIKGVGDKKAQDLGPLFLEAIRAHERDAPA